ncbi:MAG: hypothetical protein ACAI44_21680 [Candidatus Sericytochromatia bacterium]
MNPSLLLLIPIEIMALAIPAAAIYLISRTSGWKVLAEAYPLQGTFPPPVVRMGYGVFRGWVGYNGGLILGTDAKGLYLRTTPVVLAFCHAPIFILWSEISEIEPPRKAYGGFRLHTRRAPDVNFALRPRTFVRISDAARQASVPGKY